MIRLNGEVAISKYGLEILKGIKDSIGFFLDDSPLELSLSEGLADEVGSSKLQYHNQKSRSVG